MTFVTPTAPTVQISVLTADPSGLHPNLSVEVSDVDAVYAQAMQHGLEIVYPLTTELWGVRRFFVVDPNNMIINVVSHQTTTEQ